MGCRAHSWKIYIHLFLHFIQRTHPSIDFVNLRVQIFTTNEYLILFTVWQPRNWAFFFGRSFLEMAKATSGGMVLMVGIGFEFCEGSPKLVFWLDWGHVGISPIFIDWLGLFPSEWPVLFVRSAKLLVMIDLFHFQPLFLVERVGFILVCFWHIDGVPFVVVVFSLLLLFNLT